MRNIHEGKNGAWLERTPQVIGTAIARYAKRGTFNDVLAYLAATSREIAVQNKARDSEQYGQRRDEGVALYLRNATTIMRTISPNVESLTARYYRLASVEPRRSIEGHIKGTLGGEQYDLTSFKYHVDESKPVDRVWIHTHWRNVEPILDHCRVLFQVAVEPDSTFNEASPAIAELLWWFFHAHPYVRGSEDIGVWLLQYIFAVHRAAIFDFDEHPAALAFVSVNPSIYAQELWRMISFPSVWADNGHSDETLLCYHARRGLIREVKNLLRTARAESVEPTGFSALQLAAREGQVAVVDELLAQGAQVERSHLDSQQTAVHLAAAGGHEEIVATLIEHGGAIEAVDCHGNTPLHLAVRAQHPKVVKALLRAGAQIDGARDKLGRTPLHYAAQLGSDAVLKLLLKSKPQPNFNLLDKNQENALSLAATAGRAENVRCLLEYGAIAPPQNTLLTAMSVNQKGVEPFLRGEKRMDPGLYRLFLRASQEGHQEVGEILRRGLLKTLPRGAQGPATSLLDSVPMGSVTGLAQRDTGQGLLISII